MKLTKFDNVMMAVTFAEENEHAKSREIISPKTTAKAVPKNIPANHGAGLKAAVYGVISIGFIFTIFTQQELISNLYTKGKWFTFLPIATVFLYSFIHGSFANYALSYFGIEARKKH